MSELYEFQIERCNSERKKGRIEFSRFHLEVKASTTVLECLIKLKDESDSTLSFRKSCRSGICGSCAMNINGVNRLACETSLISLKKKRVFLRPLPSFKVIKDLVVDMSSFFEAFELIKPYIYNSLSDSLISQSKQSIPQRTALDGAYECIHCGACNSTCPVFRKDNLFCGPAALLKLYRYLIDSRDRGWKERLEVLTSMDGLWKCRSVYACTEVCPKGLNPGAVIDKLKRIILSDRLKLSV
ncbi:Succinate dehydrogenase iron-sulfur protein [Chitinispirillum alkaliphilum]|nr:Succinate dehydrogenase iron-sulfur protein [Chitinispirillum alkaliphilum]